MDVYGHKRVTPKTVCVNLKSVVYIDTNKNSSFYAHSSIQIRKIDNHVVRYISYVFGYLVILKQQENKQTN